MLTFNLVLGLALSERVAPSLALNLQQQALSPRHGADPSADRPVFRLTLSLCATHRLQQNCTFFKLLSKTPPGCLFLVGLHQFSPRPP